MKEMLACGGGTPVVSGTLKKKWPIITQEDIEAVVEVLKSGELGNGHSPNAVAFGEEFAAYVGAKYGLAVNSGTAALHCAVAAADIGPGDEVITSTYTFLASAVAVLHHNGIPIFVDIDPQTYNIDPSKIKEKINERTKAIMPVHIHGMPADMDEINEIAKKYNLIVIEDAAEAHGALYKGKKAGNLGDIAGFSLQSSKNLMAGEGGIITTNNAALRDKADLVRMFGEVIEKGKPRAYNAYTMGWNYRLPEMSAALARTQLRRLDDYNKIAQENADFLTRELRKIPGVIPPFVPEDRTHTYYVYRVRLNPERLGINMPLDKFRYAVQWALDAEGVTTSEWQNAPVPAQTLFQEKRGYGKGCPWSCSFSRGEDKIIYNPHDYPETLKILKGSFVLGSIMEGNVRPPNTMELMKRYVEAFQKVFHNLERVVCLYEKSGEYAEFEKRKIRLF